MLKRTKIQKLLLKGKDQAQVAKLVRCTRQYVHLIHNEMYGVARRDMKCYVCDGKLDKLHNGAYLHDDCAQLRMRLQQNRFYYGNNKKKLQQAIDKQTKGVVMCQVRLDMPNASQMSQLREISRRLKDMKEGH